MVLLGIGVRDGATTVDGFFQQAGGGLDRLVVLTDTRTAQALVLAGVLAAAYRRRWVLLPLVVAVPYAAVWASRTLKPVFGRFKEDALSYPSGHTTALVVVLGMLILALGARRWLLWAVAVVGVLGVLGQAATYHYFTDAAGSVLFGTSVVCLVALALRRLGLRL